MKLTKVTHYITDEMAYEVSNDGKVLGRVISQDLNGHNSEVSRKTWTALDNKNNRIGFHFESRKKAVNALIN